MASQKSIVLIGGAIALFLLLSRSGKAKARTVVDLQLTKNFFLQEFLSSRALPEVKYYQPTPQEIDHLKRLTGLVLQPLRDQYGPIVITGGARPDAVKDSQGRTLSDLLVAQGRGASKTSDHRRFLAADINLPGASVETYTKAWATLRLNPNVRQTLFEFKTDAKSGQKVVSHIHVAVIAPGFARIEDPNFTFVTLDGKRLADEGGNV